MSTDIILIGPIGAGKSTVGGLLSESLGLPQCSMDDLRFRYYEEVGYDRALGKKKRETEGLWSLLEYWKPFEVHAVERLLSEHHNCVIDFGAGHSVFEDEEFFKRVQQALAPYQNVVLLLPTPDPEESVEILNDREDFLPTVKPNINEHYIKHHSNYTLARFVVYTAGRTPQETCDQILRLVNREVLETPRSA